MHLRFDNPRVSKCTTRKTIRQIVTVALMFTANGIVDNTEILRAIYSARAQRTPELEPASVSVK